MFHVRPVVRAAAMLLLVIVAQRGAANARPINGSAAQPAGGASRISDACDQLAGTPAQRAKTSTHLLENQNPVAQADCFTDIKFNSVNNVLEVLANDYDPDGDPISIVSVSVDSWSGSAVISGTTLIYTPKRDDWGRHREIFYTISDGRGGIAEGLAKIEIWPRLAMPRDDYYRIPPGCVDCILDVMSNDSGGENDHRIEVGQVAPPRHGSAVPGYSEYGATHVLYAPTLGYAGADGFTYTLKESYGTSAMVGITVAAPGENATPIALDDNIAVTINSSSANLNVLGNDRDLDGHDFSITAIGQAQHGTLASLGSSVAYTPTIGFAGTDSFTYTVRDAGGLSATALASLSVGPPPTAWPGFIKLPNSLPVEGQYYSDTLVADDGNASDPLVFGSADLPAGLRLVDHGDRTATLSGIVTQPGTYTPTLSISDPHMTTSVALPLHVQEAALAITSPPPAPATYGAAYSHTLTAAALDPTAAITFSVTMGALPPGLSLDPGGVLSGIPTAAGSYPGIGLTAHSAAGSYTRPVTLSVQPAPLTITANDASRPAGQPNPPLTVRFGGFVLGDDASALSSPPSIHTLATRDSPAGRYLITPGAATATNYAITFIPGTLTVTRPLFLPLIRRP